MWVLKDKRQSCISLNKFIYFCWLLSIINTDGKKKQILDYQKFFFLYFFFFFKSLESFLVSNTMKQFILQTIYNGRRPHIQIESTRDQSVRNESMDTETGGAGREDGRRARERALSQKVPDDDEKEKKRKKH